MNWQKLLDGALLDLPAVFVEDNLINYLIYSMETDSHIKNVPKFFAQAIALALFNANGKNSSTSGIEAEAYVFGKVKNSSSELEPRFRAGGNTEKQKADLREVLKEILEEMKKCYDFKEIHRKIPMSLIFSSLFSGHSLEYSLNLENNVLLSSFLENFNEFDPEWKKVAFAGLLSQSNIIYCPITIQSYSIHDDKMFLEIDSPIVKLTTALFKFLVDELKDHNYWDFENSTDEEQVLHSYFLVQKFAALGNADPAEGFLKRASRNFYKLREKWIVDREISPLIVAALFVQAHKDGIDSLSIETLSAIYGLADSK